MDHTTPDDTETIVIFRHWQGSVIALFPELPSEVRSYYPCMSYQHIGQHGSADPLGILMSSRPAAEEEYTPLKKELEGFGYKLKVVTGYRYTHAARREAIWGRLVGTIAAVDIPRS